MTNTDHNHLQGMKRLLWSVPVLLLTILVAASCSDSDDGVEEYPDWQNHNLTQWNSLYAQAQQKIAGNDNSWKIIKNWSLQDSVKGANTDYIIVHVKSSGTGKGCPLYSDTVLVNYTGRLLPSTSYADGYQFDSSWHGATTAETAAPWKSAVRGVTDGFATALQHMHVGDEWEVYVPWTLGYGTTATSNIPAYSVLVFDIQLVNYYAAGESVPSFKAKRYAVEMK